MYTHPLKIKIERCLIFLDFSYFISSDDKNVVPYLSTQNKSVRNVFRFFMADYPQKYDYQKAQVSKLV